MWFHIIMFSGKPAILYLYRNKPLFVTLTHVKPHCHPIIDLEQQLSYLLVIFIKRMLYALIKFD